MNLKAKVWFILESMPETRECDVLLTTEIWKKYHEEYVQRNKDGDEFVTFEDMRGLPTQDGAKRYRAEFNSNGRYLPKDPAVIKQRRINEDKWREKLGYAPKQQLSNCCTAPMDEERNICLSCKEHCEANK